MSLKSANKIDTNRYELEIEISPEEFDEAVNKVFHRKAKSINIPGFRKGKAPRSFIEKYYGSQVFYDDAINEVYPEAMSGAAKEAEIEIIKDKIDFDVVKIGKEEGLTFKAAVTVKPEVEISGYRGLAIKPMPEKITDEDIEKELQNIREKNARLIPITEETAQTGDTVIFDFKGFIDEQQFQGGTAEDFSLILGSNRFIPGFEEKLVGHNIDENFSIEISFPEEYQAKHLAGKNATFEILIHEIKRPDLPELDDEFAKDISEFDTLEEYKADLFKKLEERKKEEAQQSKTQQLTEQLCNLLKADIPPAMIENQIDEESHKFANYLKSQNLDLKDYLRYNGVSMEDFRETLREKATSQVKLTLSLEKIAKLESFTPTDEELESEYANISSLYELSIEQTKKIIGKEDLIKDLSSQKAMNFVEENAKSE